MRDSAIAAIPTRSDICRSGAIHRADRLSSDNESHMRAIKQMPHPMFTPITVGSSSGQSLGQTLTATSQTTSMSLDMTKNGRLVDPWNRANRPAFRPTHSASVRPALLSLTKRLIVDNAKWHARLSPAP